jgi:streptogramin lyase
VGGMLRSTGRAWSFAMFVVVLTLLGGCAAARSGVASSTDVDGRGRRAGIAEDPKPQVRAPDQITVGPDGNLWFTNDDNGRIGRITPAGEITTFADPAGKVSSPEGITPGPDERLWFTSSGNGRIGRIGTSGDINTFGRRSLREPWAITTAPDRNVWFTDCEYDVYQNVCDRNRIGRIRPNGDVIMFRDPADRVREPDGIAAGGDGDLWFTSYESDRIGRITPAGKITTLKARARGCRRPLGITMGPDGNMWFTCNDNNRIGRITPAGETTTFPLR